MDRSGGWLRGLAQMKQEEITRSGKNWPIHKRQIKEGGRDKIEKNRYPSIREVGGLSWEVPVLPTAFKHYRVPQFFFHVSFLVSYDQPPLPPLIVSSFNPWFKSYFLSEIECLSGFDPYVVVYVCTFVLSPYPPKVYRNIPLYI